MLKGKKIVITRDFESSRKFGNLIAKRGGIPVVFPTIYFVENFEEDDFFLEKIDQFDIFIFPSKNSVKFFFKKVSANKVLSKKVFAVGDKTGEALKEKGVSIKDLPEKFTGKALSEFILKKYDVMGKNILIPSSNIAKRGNYTILSENGAKLFFWSVYLNRKIEPDRKMVEKVLTSDYITFFSPSAVSSFFEFFKRDDIALKKVVSIGPTTTEKLLNFGIKNILEAKIHNSEGVIEVIEKDIVSK